MNLTEFIGKFLRLIIEQVKDVSFVELVSMVMAGMIAVNLIALIYSRISGNKVAQGKVWLVAAIVAYICVIYQITFESRDPGTRNGIFINLDFGIYEAGYFNYNQLIYTILNVFLFIPFGVLFGLLRKDYQVIRRIIMCILYSFIASFLVEFFQFGTKRGFFELTDIVTNTFGGLIGVVLVSVVLSVVGTDGSEKQTDFGGGFDETE